MKKERAKVFFRLKNRIIAKIIARYPGYGQRLVDAYKPWESEDVPWTPISRPLTDCKVAMVTTAGVHHCSQSPFDMKDQHGDPSFREIDIRKPLSDLMITHDYYDHSDADRDINIVFPVERLREWEEKGRLGSLAQRNFSFMGHIDGHHIPVLINETGRQVASELRKDGVDVVLLTPG